MIVSQLAKEMRACAQNHRQKELKAAMLKAAAFLATAHTRSHNFERSLLYEISFCCAAYFSKQTIQVAIDCWSWTISARPDIEPLVVEEMINAWQMSVDLRLGMFSAAQAEPSPLASAESDLLRPGAPTNVDAHRIWIKYFQERLDIAKYKSDFEVELFFSLMHKTLAFSEPTGDSAISRHVSCVGLRFRFLVMALSLLQSSVIANTVAKCVLRERIYYAALDYFALSSRTPTQSYSELREDIKFILEFWNRIVAEKKYLKEENFAFNAAGNNMMLFGNGLNAGNQATPDGSMTGFNLESELTGNAGQMPLGSSVTYSSISGGLTPMPTDPALTAANREG